MRREVEFERIQQILEQQPGFGGSLHGQPPLEEETVGIFFASRQSDEIAYRGANDNIGRCCCSLHASAADAKGQLQWQVGRAQRNDPTLQRIELFAQSLATQQVVE